MSDEFQVQDVPSFVIPDHTAATPFSERVYEKVGLKGRSRLGSASNREAKPRVPKPRKHVEASKPGEFVKPISELYRTIGMLALPLDPNCAMTVFDTDDDEQSPNYQKDRAQICAESLDALAQKNDGLRQLLRTITTGGAWGAVIMAHAPIILALLSHHTPLMNRVNHVMSERVKRSDSDD